MDILILIWLSFKIRTQAIAKGEKPLIWIFRLVSLFITTELVVAMFVLSFFGEGASLMEMISSGDNNQIYLIIFPSLFLALLSAYFVFKQLAKIDFEEVNEIEENLIEEEKPNLDHFR